MPSDTTKATERDAALVMLDRIADSARFLEVIRQARVSGARDILDTPDYVARHKARQKKIYAGGGDDDEPVEVPARLAAMIAALVERDLLAGPEALIEKAIGCYLELHPEKTKGLPEVVTTLEATRRDIETGAERVQPLLGDLAAAQRGLDAEHKTRDDDRGRD